MRDLNRFEYLQLATALLSEKDKQEAVDDEDLARRMFELAQVIRTVYRERYRYEGDENNSFELPNPLERNSQVND